MNERERKKRAKRRQKHSELETIADKESRLLTKRVHRMRGETTLQLQIMRKYQRERTKHLKSQR